MLNPEPQVLIYLPTGLICHPFIIMHSAITFLHCINQYLLIMLIKKCIMIPKICISHLICRASLWHRQYKQMLGASAVMGAPVDDKQMRRKRGKNVFNIIYVPLFCDNTKISTWHNWNQLKNSLFFSSAWMRPGTTDTARQNHKINNL